VLIDESVDAMQRKIEAMQDSLRQQILSLRETSLQQLKVSAKRKHLPALPEGHLDTSIIDVKAQEICAKFHSISQDMNNLLSAAEDRIKGFENTLQAAKLLANEGAQGEVKGKTAALSLQEHLNTAY
jgi:hypothetical protein